MSRPQFVHLRLHSEFSMVDGIVRLDQEITQGGRSSHICPPVERAAADGMPAVALTDLNNLFGAVRFFQAAKSKGVQPIIGCDAYLSNEKNRDQPFRVLLLVQNQRGYLNLCELLSRGFLENQHRGHAELKREWLTGKAVDGLIVLSGAEQGDIGQALLSGKDGEAHTLAKAWQRDLGDRFYIEVQRVDAAKSAAYVDAAVHLAGELNIAVVATHPVQFMAREDFTAHEAKVCIAQGYTLSDQRRPQLFSPEQYFKSQTEMAALFADMPEALENAVEIAKRCAFEFSLGKAQLPVFSTPNGESADEYLRILSFKGLDERLTVLYPDAAEREKQRPRYAERLEFEVKTIAQMGFPGYFLIVADFINWAKRNGVPVGPGRGSGAGSLVAYSLKITDLDPLKYDLLFERFLNPERVSMPDFDIDFCQDGRDRVIQYVRNKYGHDAVSQIATFGTMAAKAAVRDVGRVMDWGYNRTDELAKLIPFQPGKLITLQMAREMEPKLKEREESEEETRELLALAEQLEGLTRNVGMHAGGVLIAPGKLTDFTPLYRAEGADAVVSQFDKDDVEKVGLVKFDFLGLTTLTIIDHAVKHIRRLKLNPGDETFDIDAIPLDDQASYKIFQSGNATAIFQFESKGMRDLLKKALPDRLDDLIALNALYRPGPMDLIPDFCDRKKVLRETGRQSWEYLDPRMAPILDPTYGIMVYQEQVMQVAQVIGGYSLGGADLLRRAMGKKKPEEMAAQREIFRQGAAKNGLAESKAMQLFDLMEKFAGYGFNKSHAAAYAWVAYQTAYLKAHHTAAFMAANLSAVMDDTDKVKMFFDDARLSGLTVLPPDINTGRYRFEPVSAKEILYGLGGVKGTGEGAIENIIAAREAGGPFRDIADFCRRVDRRVVNRRAMEALIKAGAFDKLNPNRNSLLSSLAAAIELADKAEQNASQTNLFGEAEEVAQEALQLTDAPMWSARDRLANEKQALGFYLSGHPFTAYKDEVRRVARNSLATLQPQQEPALIAGVVDQIVMRNGKRGRMAVVTLDDGTDRVEVVVFGELFNDRRAVLQADQPLIVEGRVAYDDFSGGLRITADKLLSIDDIRQARARAIKLTINGQANAKRLADLLKSYTGGPCPVMVDYQSKAGAGTFTLGPQYRVRIVEPLVRSLTDWLSESNVEVIY